MQRTDQVPTLLIQRLKSHSKTLPRKMTCRPNLSRYLPAPSAW